MSEDHMANNISQGTVCAEEVRAEETGDLDLSPMLCHFVQDKRSFCNFTSLLQRCGCDFPV